MLARLLGLALGLAAVIALAVSQSPTAQANESAWEVLQQPGAVAVMRHALAPGTGDPGNFDLGDCTTQRNLDERGRQQARDIGQAFRDRGIAVDRVLTSQWCRCRDTAELLEVAEVEDFPPLNSFFRQRARAQEQTDAVRSYLAAMPDEQRLVLVTHQVNITALTGRFPASGEIFVIDVEPDGTVSFLGEILIDP